MRRMGAERASGGSTHWRVPPPWLTSMFESAARGLSVLEVGSHSEAAKEMTRVARTLTGGPPVDALAREKAA